MNQTNPVSSFFEREGDFLSPGAADVIKKSSIKEIREAALNIEIFNALFRALKEVRSEDIKWKILSSLKGTVSPN